MYVIPKALYSELVQSLGEKQSTQYNIKQLNNISSCKDASISMSNDDGVHKRSTHTRKLGACNKQAGSNKVASQSKGIGENIVVNPINDVSVRVVGTDPSQNSVGGVPVDRDQSIITTVPILNTYHVSPVEPNTNELPSNNDPTNELIPIMDVTNESNLVVNELSNGQHVSTQTTGTRAIAESTQTEGTRAIVGSTQTEGTRAIAGSTQTEGTTHSTIDTQTPFLSNYGEDTGVQVKPNMIDVYTQSDKPNIVNTLTNTEPVRGHDAYSNTELARGQMPYSNSGTIVRGDRQLYDIPPIRGNNHIITVGDKKHRRRQTEAVAEVQFPIWLSARPIASTSTTPSYSIRSKRVGFNNVNGAKHNMLRSATSTHSHRGKAVWLPIKHSNRKSIMDSSPSNRRAVTIDLPMIDMVDEEPISNRLTEQQQDSDKLEYALPPYIESTSSLKVRRKRPSLSKRNPYGTVRKSVKDGVSVPGRERLTAVEDLIEPHNSNKRERALPPPLVESTSPTVRKSVKDETPVPEREKLITVEDSMESHNSNKREHAPPLTLVESTGSLKVKHKRSSLGKHSPYGSVKKGTKNLALIPEREKLSMLKDSADPHNADSFETLSSRNDDKDLPIIHRERKLTSIEHDQPEVKADSKIVVERPNLDRLARSDMRDAGTSNIKPNFSSKTVSNVRSARKRVNLENIIKLSKPSVRIKKRSIDGTKMDSTLSRLVARKRPNIENSVIISKPVVAPKKKFDNNFTLW